MKDTIRDLDTSAIIALIVTGACVLAFMGKAENEFLMFLAGVVAAIMGKNAKV